MNSTLTQLSDRSLRRLLEALTSGRLTTPFSSLTLAQLVPQDQVSSLLDELCRMQHDGLTPSLLVAWIRTLLQQRERILAESRHLELVMTGPEPPGTMVRDTGVVVRQLFRGATESLWIAGFAIHQGREIFDALALQMTELPSLKVRMFLNIDRPYGDASGCDHLIARFQRRFRESQWPAEVRLPEIYFDPRSLEPDDAGKSACLHAKFVIADSRQLFISSANFTEAAQQRNIEAGLLSDSAELAGKLQQHFQSLIDHGYLKKLRWYELPPPSTRDVSSQQN
jgi:hypothetical protein